jgi:hypothetical protein
MYLLARPSADEKDEATGENSPALICPHCPLFNTKPGQESLHITLAQSFAMEHEEEVKNGYRFANLDSLSPMQWASVRGLSRGRAKYDEWWDAERRKETPPPMPK